MNLRQTPILAARGVVKTYRTGLHEVRALRGVDLDVHHGELVMVMGPSGHGNDTGTITIFEDGTARYVSDTGVEAWLTDEVQTYNWVC